MKLTVLVDNNTYIDQYYLGEPAVSYYIEAEGNRILFDTGYSHVFLSNAQKMNIPLNRLTHVVLSHGHNDHTNGLPLLWEQTDLSGVRLVAHPDCFLPKYDGDLYIGAPCSAREAGERMDFCPSREPVWLSDRLVYLGEIPRTTSFEANRPLGRQRRGEAWEGDRLLDDTALAYRTPKGLFIITGCSHSGICNIIRCAQALCGEPRVLGVLGGFHLLEEDDRLRQTIEFLAACGLERLYPCHCISLAAKARMLERLPVTEVGVGMTVEIP